LLEDLLILNARYLRLVNEFGIKKIFRNMLALQQSIKALQRDGTPTDIDRAKLYYAMYFRSPTVSVRAVLFSKDTQLMI
jgi:exocyst complex component 4